MPPPSTLFLREDLHAYWVQQDVFACVREQSGDIYRDKEGRRTLRFRLGTNSYFLKYHRGVGWVEIIKNLLQGRLPVISARNEWEAVKRLQDQGVATLSLAGYGERGWNPARRESFVISDELIGTMSLEHLGTQWRNAPPSPATRRQLIHLLADITRRMHDAGINHRDYYLCHFLLEEGFAAHNTVTPETRLCLIDLHRAQLRRNVPRRWRIKDLAGLYFSAHQVPLSARDKLRFIRHYRRAQGGLRFALREEAGLWARVARRADELVSKEQRSQQRP